MTAQSSIPLKFYVPFAQNDSSRVELPITTSDATRASQSLGFPPLTMQPPESGGVPPQGEDFNGGMNQIARVAWWVLNGGGWPFDATFASNSNINGYPNGAKLQGADLLGDWISTADNNQANPDTNGANWVPGYQYGWTTVSGLTGGSVTLTPAQAAKETIVLTGTLTSAQTIVLPTWLKRWRVFNNTSGAFVVIVKTASGSGVTTPQVSASPTWVFGDGTNIVQVPENIAAATTTTQPPQFGQVLGKFKTYAGTGTFTHTVAQGVTTVYITSIPPGGGGGGGGSAIAGTSSSGAGGGGGGGGAGTPIIKQATTVAAGQVLTITHGAPGSGGLGSNAIGTSAQPGTAGGNVTITGASPTVNITVTGGPLGAAGNNANGATTSTAANGGSSGGGGGSGGGFGVIGSGAVYGGFGGAGGASMLGAGGGATVSAGGNAPGNAGVNAPSYGAGGSGGGGGAAATSTVAEGGALGGNGGAAYTIIEW